MKTFENTTMKMRKYETIFVSKEAALSSVMVLMENDPEIFDAAIQAKILCAISQLDMSISNDGNAQLNDCRWGVKFSVDVFKPAKELPPDPLHGWGINEVNKVSVSREILVYGVEARVEKIS